MKLHAKRLLSLLMAMVMALSFAAPVVAEHLDEDAAPETAAVSAQEADAQESASQDQVPEISSESEEDASEEEAVSDSSAQEEQEAPAGEQAENATDTADSLQKQEENADPAQSDEQVITLKVLETAQLALENAEAQSISSSDESILTVDETGMMQAQHVGEAVVTATDQQGKISTFLVEVRSTTTKCKKSLYAGNTTTLKLEDRDLFSVQSDDERIAEVEPNGKVTAHRSGVVDITLTDTLGDLHVCTLTVKGVLSAKKLTLSETEKKKLSFKGSDIRNAKSSNNKVVTVDGKGKVEAIKAGSAVLTLTDASGSTAKCTVKVEPNYLARTAKNAKRIYRKIETLGCRHVSGVHTYSQLVKRKHCSCTTGPSLALQAAGVLPVGKTVSHTKAGSERKKLKSVDKGISCRKNLKKGTFTIYKANCRFSKLPAKYKAAGMVYVQDSNICVSAGDGYIYSCNESSRQYRHGHYFRTKMKAGYTHSHKILYVIAPNS